MTGAGPEPDGLDAAVAAILARYRDDLLGRLATVEAALRSLAAGSLDDEARQAARREAHTLAGSLGTLGLVEATGLIRRIEASLAPEAAEGSAEAALAAVPPLQRLLEAVEPPPAGA